MFTASGREALHLSGSDVGTVVDRLPAEQWACLPHQTFPIGSGPGTVEELELDDRTDRDEPDRRGSEPGGGFRVPADQRHQRTRIDEELGGTHRR